MSWLRGFFGGVLSRRLRWGPLRGSQRGDKGSNLILFLRECGDLVLQLGDLLFNRSDPFRSMIFHDPHEVKLMSYRGRIVGENGCDLWKRDRKLIGDTLRWLKWLQLLFQIQHYGVTGFLRGRPRGL